MTLVGLCGKARSGKDTVGNMLATKHGYKRFAFADRLKDVVRDINPYVPVEAPEVPKRWVRLDDLVHDIGWERSKENPVVRQYLQNAGTGMRGRVGKNVWVDPVLMQSEAEENSVITDCRFLNEAEAIHDKGGLLVRIIRPGGGLQGGLGNHVSETDLDGTTFDWTIVNDGSMRVLEKQVDALEAHIVGMGYL